MFNKITEELSSTRQLSEVRVNECTPKAIDGFVADLWHGSIYASVFVVSPMIWNTIWNGLEPNNRKIAETHGNEVFKLSNQLVREGFQAFPYFGGNLFMDKYVSDFEMYAFCAEDLTAKHNGHLAWKVFVPNKNSEQLLEERLVAIETKIGMRKELLNEA
jgi:hypothetical protein